MTKEDLSACALASGWKLRGKHISLSRPSRPDEAIVRLVLKATVANIEIKKPSGKWDRVGGAPYPDIAEDPETGVPRGLGLVTIQGLSKLMQDNRDANVFG